METRTIAFFLGKYVKLILSSGRVYTGKIKKIVDNNIIIFGDSAGFDVVIDIEDIVAIEDRSAFVEKYKKTDQTK